jgi:hypothetical protein
MKTAMRDLSSSSNRGLSLRGIISFELTWAFLAILFFLLFSVPDRTGYPIWYSWGTAVLELVAYFIGTLLCFRNVLSPKIVSGRRVWLCLSLGMFSYFAGGIFFTYWEIVLGREPAVSPGDIFYIIAYVCWMLAMVLAVSERRLHLEPIQWIVLILVGFVGVLVGVWLSTPFPGKPMAELHFWRTPPAMAAIAPTPAPIPSDLKLAQTQASPRLRKNPQSTLPAKPQAVSPTKTTKAAGTAVPAATAPSSSDSVAKTPPWVSQVENVLQPIERPLNLLYIIADTFLLIIATALLLAFWGGRSTQSWRLIAAAIFCLYISDAWFKYATTNLKGYESGGLLEIGWVLSGILMGIAAALEYDLIRTRRSSAVRRHSL